MKKRSNTFRYGLVLLIFISSLSQVIAQNLVPNPSFEELDMCPLTGGFGGPTVAPPWVAPTLGTCDIFNECNNPGAVGVPMNFAGSQDALSGVGYAGFYTRVLSNPYREYIQAPLDEPLVAGSWYSVNFFVSLAESNSCAIQNIGAYF